MRNGQTTVNQKSSESYRSQVTKEFMKRHEASVNTEIVALPFWLRCWLGSPAPPLEIRGASDNRLLSVRHGH